MFLFNWIETHRAAVETLVKKDGKGIVHKFRRLNDAPLNATHFDIGVNFLEHVEIKPDGTITTWTWVTDPTLTAENVMQVMRAARTRWRKTLRPRPEIRVSMPMSPKLL